MRIQYIHTLFSAREPDVALIEPVRAQLEDISLNHESNYIERVQRSCKHGRYVDLDPDTVCSEDSFDTALYAAGSLLRLVKMALAGEIKSGFASVRPPGHHAVTDEAMGFCLFNNIAIAAQKAVTSYGVERVIIIDFDVHHGNGTQDSFYGRKDILYFSSHQYPFYPGTGRLSETGARGSEGYTINCPLRSGKTDGEMIALYKSVLMPVIYAYKPGLVLVSAGFDAHAMDPIGGMDMTSAGFGALACMIHEAAEYVRAPVVYSLEGGYNFDALRDSVKAVIDVMRGGSKPKIEERCTAEIDEIIKTHSRYWSL